MGWKVAMRRLGRAGGPKERNGRQREWDRKFGEGNWEIGYVIDGEFRTQDSVYESVYVESYRQYFDANPEELDELCRLAKVLRNPHSVATGGVDLQIPAVQTCLQERGKELAGDAVVDIGTWKGERSHTISERLSPLQVPCALNPKVSLEKFWQSKKCLARWVED